jgi:hypothetical protein
VPNSFVPEVVSALGQWRDTYKMFTGSSFPFSRGP